MTPDIMTTAQWDAVTHALIKVVILSFLIERALAVIFDMERFEPVLNVKDAKAPIAIAVSIAACVTLGIDAIGPLRGRDALTDFRFLGEVLTGLVVAGGSAGAVKLFQDVLGFRRTSREQLRQVEKLEHEAEKAEANARLQKAEAEAVTARARVVDTAARISAPKGRPESAKEQMLAVRIAARDIKIAQGK